MIALYQNGERIMPGNGYPMRLLLPGYEGNMNVKYLRRIKLADQPAMTYYEARNYSPLLPDGKAYRFYFLKEVKIASSPSPRSAMTLKEPGYLRDLRHRLFGHRPHRQGHGLGRRRQELGRSGAAGAGASQGLHPLPHAVALGRPAGGAAEPRLGRGRQRAAAARGLRRRARPDQEPVPNVARLSPTSTTTASPAGASTPRGRSSMSMRKPLRSPPPLALTLAAAAGARRRRARSSASRSPRPTSRPGTSPSCRTAPTCRPAAAPRRKAPRSSRRNAPPATARAARAASIARAGRRPAADRAGIEADKTIANFWADATTLFDYIRRAMPWPHAALADRPGGLCLDRLYPRAQQADRRERRDGRQDPAEGEDAEPRQLHHQVPGQI